MVLVLVPLALVGWVQAVSAAEGGRPFSTTLTGAAEVPGPGDPDATGQADLTLNPGQQEVCLEISWANIDGEVFAGHIHAGTATVAGPVVVTLFTGSFASTDSVSGCVAADRALIKDILQNPTNYYVNVHSRPNFPGGAVRGQLGD
jgi:CHRD domain